MTLANGSMMSNATWRKANAMSNRRAHVGSEMEEKAFFMSVSSGGR